MTPTCGAEYEHHDFRFYRDCRVFAFFQSEALPSLVSAPAIREAHRASVGRRLHLGRCGHAPEEQGEEAPVSATRTTFHRARVSWDADEVDVRAHSIALAGQRLAASSAGELGGNPEKADPEEMFVASLSSCHMLWFLALARAEGLEATSYEDEPEGALDGTRFTRVVLRPRVVFDRDPLEEQVASLHHRAHERCFIANSVACPVEVVPRA